MAGYTTTGIIGTPSAASADKGRAVLEALASGFEEHIKLLLDEPTSSR
jgi:creatinine amidohydrolase